MQHSRKDEGIRFVLRRVQLLKLLAKKNFNDNEWHKCFLMRDMGTVKSGYKEKYIRYCPQSKWQKQVK